MYTSSRETPHRLWWQPVDGSAAATKVHASLDQIREGVFTPDGSAIVYRVDTRATNRDIWLVPLTGERTPVPLLITVADEKEPRVSPDSRWLAYVSNESGREEVYVRPLTAGGGRVPVSAGGGGEPLWAPDGRHIYYRAADKVMEATLITSPSLGISARRALFAGAYASDIYHADYDVAPDGASFVMVRPVESNRRVVIVVNWVRELRQRMAGIR
jgi:serine/threonine-protein kinase